ncbi:aminotransferase class-III domain-containing protein [Ditylenchus destructor]|nr:aminotransferase class-III domain-containing protein [Ditylenchus destructor]
MDLLFHTVPQILGYFNVNNSTLVEKIKKITPNLNKTELLQKRKKYIGSKCQIFYDKDPFVVSSASMQYLYDEEGNQFIDCISNVQHECAEQLLKTLPGLDTVLFCNSGSEANDLAMRLARDFTNNEDIIVLDHAYHGHITSTMMISPYKFDHGSTIMKPEWVHVAPVPDVYRGQFPLEDNELCDESKLMEAGQKYANSVHEILESTKQNNRRVAAYIAEALQSCGGFIPDIVTMGKPMGNGFPVAAVVTRKEIADKLGGEAAYFNTYGGNPVACAAVLGVLKVINDEKLLDHSQKMGGLFERELRALMQKHNCIGDIRGVGMFWGLDIVKDRRSREPDSELALALIMKLRQQYGVLLNADGPHTNILKFKPPLCFSESDLRESVSALDKALSELCIK